jgi:hypothetical protein
MTWVGGVRAPHYRQAKARLAASPARRPELI